jgi:hypothetical protein
MRRLIHRVALVPLLTVALLPSCDVFLDTVIDNVFESKRDRHIREDSRNLERGRPLEHYSTERRLKVDRENRLFEDLTSDF